MITKHTGFIILGSTDCYDSRSENFVQGIFKDEESAKATVEHHRRQKTVSSKFSETGKYTVKPVDYELINDGRILIAGRVLDNDIFLLRGEDEYFSFS